MISRHLSRLLVAGGVALCVNLAASPALASTVPSGERQHGQVSVEPAYDDVTGNLIYLATPTGAPNPTHTSPHAVAPFYLVEYPPSPAPTFTLNCAGVPGNCPDHDLAVAGAATAFMSDVYGTNPFVLPGHDHLVAPPASHGDFNIAWEVIEVLFTNNAYASHHLTTLAAINTAVQTGNAKEFDLGFAFHCSVVSAAAYWNGTPS